MYGTDSEVLWDEILNPSTSSWSFPVVMIQKPNGEDRFRMDFRRYNTVLKSDAYPLPENIDNELRESWQAKCIGFVNPRSTYCQTELEEVSHLIQKFIPGFKLFQFIRKPFKLKLTPVTVQRLVDLVRGQKCASIVVQKIFEKSGHDSRTVNHHRKVVFEMGDTVWNEIRSNKAERIMGGLA